MQWDRSPNAGFTTGTPWSAVNPNFEDINAEAGRGDLDSVFAHFQQLIRLRHENEAVQSGRFELLLPDHEQLWVFTRGHDDEELLVLANCSSSPAAIPYRELPSMEGKKVLIGTHTRNTMTAPLAPWESVVLQ